MTDRELMQMALDALEYLATQTRSVYSAEKAIEALRARLAQPELGVTLTATKHPVSLGKPSEYKLSKESLEGIVLEREWQGLTDEDIKTMWDNHIIPVFNKNGISPFVFARAIEAKLRAKNT